MITLLLALTCNVAVAQAKLAEAATLIAESRQMTSEIAELSAVVADDRALIAHEKANPSGVVDLVQLHTLGAEIQLYQGQIAADEAVKARDTAAVRKLQAEVKAMIAVCKARR